MEERRVENGHARFVHLTGEIRVWFVGRNWWRRYRQVSISGMGWVTGCSPVHPHPLRRLPDTDTKRAHITLAPRFDFHRIKRSRIIIFHRWIDYASDRANRIYRVYAATIFGNILGTRWEGYLSTYEGGWIRIY